MPMNIEYVGDFFAYFVIAFGAIILTPFTFKKFRSSKNSKEEEKLNEKREKHGNSKWFKKKEADLKTLGASPWISRFVILLCWAVLFFIGYTASQTEEVVTVVFDPFEILGVSQNDPQFQDFESGKKSIKKIYRDLSRTNHPDKLRNEYLKANDGAEIPDEMETTNNEAWGKINKAYETLTDPLMFENWVKYGNPDGMLQTKYGVALPAWIVAEENHMYVLGLYGLLFGIMLPAIVGNWWYKSIQYTSEAVLIKTTKLFEFYVYRTPLMNRRRALMVFSGAFEFNANHNKDVKERPGDAEQLPVLMREIEEYERNVSKPPTDKPFDQGYSMKVRLLYFAHMYDIKLSPELQEDLDMILKKVPDLHAELVSKVFFLTQAMLQQGQMPKVPKVETLDNIIRNMQNLVQGLPLNQRSVAFMQLPHFKEDFIRFLNAKKARSLKQLAARPIDEIQAIFKSLPEKEFNELYEVFRDIPALQMKVDVKVEDDDDDHKITTGSIVTVSTELTRHNMEDLSQAASNGEEIVYNDGDMGEVKISPTPEQKETANQAKKLKSKKGPQAAAAKRAAKAAREAAEKGAGDGPVEEDEEEEDEDETETPENDSDVEDAEDKTWKRLQKKNKRKNVLTADNSRITHTVHAPRYPSEKQEWWWVYLCMTNPKREKLSERLLCEPVQVQNLVDVKEVDIRFPAPGRPGMYNFVVYVRSDSYIDIDLKHEFTVKVEEKVEEEILPEMWDSEAESDVDGGFVTDSDDETSSSEEETDSEDEE